MATHSGVLAWRIPVTGEPGGLPSMGSHRVRHDWSDLAATWVGHVSPPSWTTFHLSPNPISLGCSRALLWVPCFVHRTCTDHSILKMVIYMFLAILSNHATLAFSHWVQKSVLYICVSLCCPACRIMGTIFLNSIYKQEYTVFIHTEYIHTYICIYIYIYTEYTVFLFLTYFTLYNRL